jgi:hypothetical protein
MNLSKFVLNKTNFECYRTEDPFTNCFIKLVPCRKINLVYSTPFQIAQDILHNRSTISTLLYLCKSNKLNIWIVHENQCIHVGAHPPTHIVDNLTILKWEGQSYDTCYHDGPLYALSHYSVPDLRKIAIQLNIPISKTKKQIYNDISLKLIK